MEPNTSTTQPTTPHIAPPHVHREQLQAQLSYASSSSSQLSPPPPLPVEDAPLAPQPSIRRLTLKVPQRPIASTQPAHQPPADSDLDAEGEEDIESDDPPFEDERPSLPTDVTAQMARSTRQSSARNGRPNKSESEFEDEDDVEDEQSFSEESDDDGESHHRDKGGRASAPSLGRRAVAPTVRYRLPRRSSFGGVTGGERPRTTSSPKIQS